MLTIAKGQQLLLLKFYGFFFLQKMKRTKKNHIKENHVTDGDTENHSLYNVVNSRQRSIHNSKKDSLILMSTGSLRIPVK